MKTNPRGPRFRVGDRVHISGDSADLWLKDYNVRVDTYATVEREPRKHDHKLLVTLDSIDGDGQVLAFVRMSRVAAVG